MWGFVRFFAGLLFIGLFPMLTILIVTWVLAHIIMLMGDFIINRSSRIVKRSKKHAKRNFKV